MQVRFLSGALLNKQKRMTIEDLPRRILKDDKEYYHLRMYVTAFGRLALDYQHLSTEKQRKSILSVVIDDQDDPIEPEHPEKICSAGNFQEAVEKMDWRLKQLDSCIYEVEKDK